MTAKIKLNAASGGGSVSIQAPSSSSNNRVISLPDIADGTLLTSQSSLDSTKLTPAISGGITMLDQWTLSSNYNVNGGESNLTADNWSRTSHSLFGSIGSAMTVSSGVFTFPTTGIYVIIAAFTGKPQSSASTYVGMKIQGTSDSFSSSDVFMASNYDSCSSSSEYAHVSAVAVFDCTNTSTHKIRFRTEVQNAFQWSSGQGRGPTFIRIGDT
jgi:hypothetical protein